MGDFKLRLSDIFRYIAVGAVQATLLYYIYKDTISSFLSQEKSCFGAVEGFVFGQAIATVVVALSFFYLLGYVTQVFIQLFCKGNFMGTGLGEVGYFIKNCPSYLSCLNRYDYPHWIYYSCKPDKVLSIYRDIMETRENADVKTEYLYVSNLFQGIAFTLVMFFILMSAKESLVCAILLSLITILLLRLLGSKSVTCIRATILNKAMIVIVPGVIIGYTYLFGDDKFLSRGESISLGVAIFACLCIAEQLIRSHICRIDVFIKYGNSGETEPHFMDTLQRTGVPRAYILTRVSDSSFEYYEEQLKSIADQVYPNIKSIVLVDRQSKKYDEIIKVIEEYRKKGLDIAHYVSEGSGPAALAYEIRDIFLNYAEEDDVAISLDADDLFAKHNVVSIIMGRMARTKSNICLLTFEFFGDSRLNFSKNYPNEVVREIASDFTEKGKCITASDLLSKRKAHLISTIGWTKCYRASVIKKYQRLWDPYKDKLDKYTKYEDFPDIVALLCNESRICAVGRTSILFRKHQGSVTTDVTVDNYQRYIPFFLGMAIALSKASSSISEEARQLVRQKFVPYKFVQYLNIVYKKTTKPDPGFENYSPSIFYDSFVRNVYSMSLDTVRELQDGMVAILKDNYDLVQQDHVGYYDKDLPEELVRKDLTFDNISEAYDL